MLKSTTFLLVAAGVLLAGSAVGLGIIITKLDPSRTLNVILLYITVFVLISSTTLLIGFYIRRLIGARELTPKHFTVSLRQSIWFGLMVVVSLLLLSLGFFSLWNAILLALSLTFLESYFLFK